MCKYLPPLKPPSPSFHPTGLHTHLRKPHPFMPECNLQLSLKGPRSSPSDNCRPKGSSRIDAHRGDWAHQPHEQADNHGNGQRLQSSPLRPALPDARLTHPLRKHPARFRMASRKVMCSDSKEFGLSIKSKRVSDCFPCLGSTFVENKTRTKAKAAHISPTKACNCIIVQRDGFQVVRGSTLPIMITP